MRLTQENIAKLNSILDKFLHLNTLLTYEEVVLDKKLCYKLEKERNELSPIAKKYEEYLNLSQSLVEFGELLNTSSNDQHLIQDEINSIQTQLENVSNELKSLLNSFGASLQDVVIEIVDNKNSSELRKTIELGYSQFAKNNNLQIETTCDKNTTFLKLSGINIKSILMDEVGLHISNDGQSCSVFLYDNYTQEDVSFNESDIEITITRSSGAGGQHINTTDSAIKITHLKTGITATCQSERSQIQNRDKALATLKERVISHYENLKNEYISNSKKEQVKLMKNKYVAKNYDFELGLINKNKNTIILKDFLQGKEI